MATEKRICQGPLDVDIVSDSANTRRQAEAKAWPVLPQDEKVVDFRPIGRRANHRVKRVQAGRPAPVCFQQVGVYGRVPPT